MARYRPSSRLFRAGVDALETRRLLSGNIHLTSASLVDSSFNPDPTPTVGSQVYVRIQFSTVGLAPSATYDVAVTFGGVPFSYNINWGAGNPGTDNWIFDYGLFSVPRGNGSVSVSLDPTNTVAETNEADNTAAFQYTPIQLPPTGKMTPPIDAVAERNYSYSNYTDQDPNSGSQADYRGGPRTYDTHDGIDMTVASFANMDAGVPIVAALGGTVVFAQDGFYDRNTAGGFDANLIEIDSGNGYQQYYYHLREGSVAVKVGDVVQQGQVIGLMGASGNAFGAHLHFGFFNGGSVEPFTDPFTYWQNPAPYQGDVDAVIDSGVTNYAPNGILNQYERPPEYRNFKQQSGQIAYAWFIYDSAANKPLAITYYKPNGTTYSTTTFTTGDNAGGYSYTQSNLPASPDLGTWQVALTINGVELARNSFTVSVGGAAGATVTQGGAFIASNRETPVDGGTYSLGASSSALSFTVTNFGNATMTLGAPTLPAGWTLTDALVASLAPGASDTLGVKLDTSVAGFRYGNLSFTTSDPNTPTYSFALSGTVNPTIATPALALYTRDNSAAETGLQAGIVRITRAGDLTNPLTVNYAITGSASNGSDYNTLASSVIIPAGQSAVSVIVTPKDDGSPESSETVILTLAAGSYTIGPSSAATITIADNDTAGTASISGAVYFDKNFNTYQDAGETALGGIGLFLDSNNDGVRQTGEPMTTTNGSGNYSFTALSANYYNVRELPGSIYIFTTPVGAYHVDAAQALSGTNFGAFPTTFTGTAAADTFTVSPSGAGKIQINVNGTIYTATRSQIPALTFNGAGGSDALTVDTSGGGPYTAQTIAFDGGGGFDTVSATHATIKFTAAQTLTSLSIDANSLVTLANTSTATIVNSLTDLGTLDIGASNLILDYASMSQLSAIALLVKTGRNGGTWNGLGIISTSAKTTPQHNTTLGTMEASDFRVIYGVGVPFSGQTIDNTAVLVKYTYYGDANFNGKVDGGDYAKLDFGFSNHLTGWFNGDFNGDGKVDGSDYGLIDFAFGTQSTIFWPAPPPASPPSGKLGGGTSRR